MQDHIVLTFQLSFQDYLSTEWIVTKLTRQWFSPTYMPRHRNFTEFEDSQKMLKVTQKSQCLFPFGFLEYHCRCESNIQLLFVRHDSLRRLKLYVVLKWFCRLWGREKRETWLFVRCFFHFDNINIICVLECLCVKVKGGNHCWYENNHTDLIV